MITWAKNRWGTPQRFLMALLIVSLAQTGCSKQAGSEETAKPSSDAQTASTTDMSQARGPVVTAEKTGQDLGPAPMDAWHQPFALATRSSDNPPEGAERPPDTTVSGKPVFKLLAEVQRLWNDIRFTTSEGKPILYTATIETALGKIVIALHQDWAPNHVRNFVALARAGYYDGLRFDRIVHQEGNNAPVQLEQIQAGCPLGTGDFRYGSIGYWLQPEFNEQLHHEEGTVGACHGAEADSAACRFYINLSKAPFLDGNYTIFGKVVEGMEVVRRIHRQPTILDAQDVGGSHRPKDPVVIQKVTIQTREGAIPAGTEGQ